MIKGKILITPRTFVNRGKDQIQRLMENGWDVQLNDTGEAFSYEEFVNAAQDATGLIVGVDCVDEAMLRQCPGLKAIAKYGVGVDNIDLSVAEELGITVTRTVGSNSSAVAEYAVALMFACTKNLVKNGMNVKLGQWNRTYERAYSMELEGKTLGILGFGHIGQRVARLAKGIGMDVVVYDSIPVSTEIQDEYQVSVSSFASVITASDIVSLHLPLTDETRHLINEEVLLRMKENAILINTSRGGIVDERALLESLKSHHLFAAGFDVYSVEPPLLLDELIAQDNFILTPHTASKSFESDTKTMRMAVDNIMESLGGKQG